MGTRHHLGIVREERRVALVGWLHEASNLHALVQIPGESGEKLDVLGSQAKLVHAAVTACRGSSGGTSRGAEVDGGQLEGLGRVAGGRGRVVGVVKRARRRWRAGELGDEFVNGHGGLHGWRAGLVVG